MTNRCPTKKPDTVSAFHQLFHGYFAHTTFVICIFAIRRLHITALARAEP